MVAKKQVKKKKVVAKKRVAPKKVAPKKVAPKKEGKSRIPMWAIALSKQMILIEIALCDLTKKFNLLSSIVKAIDQQDEKKLYESCKAFLGKDTNQTSFPAKDDPTADEKIVQDDLKEADLSPEYADLPKTDGPAKFFTKDDISQALHEVSAKFGLPAVKDILKTLKAKNISAIKQKHYKNVIAMCENFGTEGTDKKASPSPSSDLDLF